MVILLVYHTGMFQYPIITYLVEMSPRRSGLVGSPVGSSRLECSPLLEELFSIFSSVFSDTATLMSLSVTVLLAATEEDSSEEASFEGSGVAGAAS